MPSADPRDQPEEQPGDQPEEQRAEPPGPQWDPSGLELARAVAGALANARAANRRGSRRARRRALGVVGVPSGARADDRDPQQLDTTIDRLVADRGWRTNVAVAGALARWDQIVGPEVAAHCVAESYDGTELTVRADSTSWATQVRMLAPDLVKRLDQELGDGTVTRVNVLGPSAPSWRKGPRSVRDGRGPRDTYG